jgi:hypothetical protein
LLSRSSKDYGEIVADKVKRSGVSKVTRPPVANLGCGSAPAFR